MPATSVRIDPNLLQAVKEAQPSWQSTTSFLNDMVKRGLATLDSRVTLGEPEQKTKTHKESEGSTSKKESYIEHIKENKEKKFRFSKSLIPYELEQHSELIEEFWKAKTGRKSEASWKQLITGLIKLQQKYKDQIVEQQLKKAIVGGPKGPWSTVSLESYEQFNKVSSINPELPSNGQASRVFTAERGFLD